MRKVVLFVCLCSVGAVSMMGQVASGSYTRKIVAMSGNTISGKTLINVGQPTLSNKGQVAFIAFSPGLVGVFTPERLVAQTGDVIAGATLTGIAGPPAIGDKGRIIFNAATNRGTGIYSSTAAIVETGDRIDGKLLTNIGPAQMSGTGDLAFLSEFGGRRGIFSKNALIAQQGDSVDGKTLVDVGFAPAVNDRGTIVVLGFYSDGNGIFARRRGFLVKTGDTVGGKTLTRVGFASINNDGDVAFIGFFQSGSGVFTRSSLLAQSGTIAGKRVGSFGTVKLNDYGVVAFTSLPDYTSAECRLCNGVFVSNSVIAYTGDVIDGKTVSSIAHDIAINDASQVVFAAAFTDGTTGIILATPTTPLTMMRLPRAVQDTHWDE